MPVGETDSGLPLLYYPFRRSLQLEIFIEIIKAVADGVLMVIQIAMLVRAVMSWFPIGENIFSDAAFALTEPIIIPVRNLLDRFEAVRNFPIDISFFVTFVIISVISALLFP